MEEKQLVLQVLKGSESAFCMLIERYKRLVFHMVGRVVDNEMDSEELCQDVFIKVYEKLGTFQFESKLSTWIATIAYRAAVNFSKKKKIPEVDLGAVSFQVGITDEPLEKEDTKQFVLKLIRQLPSQYRTVLSLYYLEEFTYPEIVEITGMPEGTVKNYLHRAKGKLKSEVNKYIVGGTIVA